MLTMEAFNALLKTLEEPPEHVVFILATTEQHKLPATIVSRCQRFDFRRISLDDISSRLAYIADKEGISLEGDAARMIAKQAQGGMRDAINLFELCAGGGHAVTGERVRTTLGITGLENAHKCALAVKNGDFETIFASVADVISSSKDIAVFWQELISFWRDMLVTKSTKDFANYLDLTGNESELLTEAAGKFTTAELVYHSSLLDEALISMNKIPQMKRNTAELTLIKMATPSLDSSPSALMARLSALEDKVKLLGNAPARSVSPAVSESSAAVVSEEKSGPVPVTESAPSTPKAPAKAVETSGKFREIADKSELLEKIASINPILKSFFGTASCFVSADREEAVVQVPNSFAASMLTSADSLQTIGDALVLCGAAEPGCNIKIKVKEQTETSSLMDELDEL